MAKKKPVNYIDNKTFYAHLVEYREVCEAVPEGGQLPRIPEKIGMAMYQIANRLASKPNFRNYPYIDEMICDGIENAMDSVLKFDPTHPTKNPFAYFTQNIYFAFLRRIEKEKKLLLTKKKYKEHKYMYMETADYSLIGMEAASAVMFESQNNGVRGQVRTSGYLDDLEISMEAKAQAKRERSEARKKEKEDAKLQGTQDGDQGNNPA
jgi:hypothetical protein